MNKRNPHCRFTIEEEKVIINSYFVIKDIKKTGKVFNCSFTCIRNILEAHAVERLQKAGNQEKDSLKCFWEKVDIKKKDECWNWKGALDGNGKNYGRINLKGKGEGAHRFSYIIHYGKIPLNMRVLHKCDNRKCVNPFHLFLGTQFDNVQDMVAKGRNRNQYTKITKGVVL